MSQKLIVPTVLQLTDVESKAFWPVYENKSITLDKKDFTVKKMIVFLMLVFSGVAGGAPIPDTGQTKCYSGDSDTIDVEVITCPTPDQKYYGQDANYSINPISYTKLDDSRNELSDSASSWAMVRDNVTGLIWETKTNKNGKMDYRDPHNANNIYSWYDSNLSTNGGNPGTQGTEQTQKNS